MSTELETLRSENATLLKACQDAMADKIITQIRHEEELARVSAEMEHHKSVKETTDAAHRELSREHTALRARFAELVALLASEKAARNAIIAKGQQAEQRVAELERKVKALSLLDDVNNGIALDVMRERDDALRDTELVNWLDDHLSYDWSVKLFGSHGVADDGGPRSIRSAIASYRAAHEPKTPPQ